MKNTAIRVALRFNYRHCEYTAKRKLDTLALKRQVGWNQWYYWNQNILALNFSMIVVLSFTLFINFSTASLYPLHSLGSCLILWRHSWQIQWIQEYSWIIDDDEATVKGFNWNVSIWYCETLSVAPGITTPRIQSVRFLKKLTTKWHHTLNVSRTIIFLSPFCDVM